MPDPSHEYNRLLPRTECLVQTGAVQPAVERVYPGDCSEAQCQHGLFNQITLVKGRYPHLKFILSVGGWTDSGPFYEMALRNAIAPSKLLTVAVGAGARAIDRLECAEMAVVLDWVNVMTYDFHSGGRRAGFNSALYNHDDPTNARSNTDAAVQALLTKAFRERSWLSVFRSTDGVGVASSRPGCGLKAAAWIEGDGGCEENGVHNEETELTETNEVTSLPSVCLRSLRFFVVNSVSFATSVNLRAVGKTRPRTI